MNRFSAQYQSTNPFLAQRAVYRYGFQGQEEDGEIKGDAYSKYFKMRILDPRLGRWLSIDPYSQFVFSQYAAMANNPIVHVDIDGGWIPGLTSDGTIYLIKEKGDNGKTLIRYFGGAQRALNFIDGKQFYLASAIVILNSDNVFSKGSRWYSEEWVKGDGSPWSNTTCHGVALLGSRNQSLINLGGENNYLNNISPSARNNILKKEYDELQPNQEGEFNFKEDGIVGETIITIGDGHSATYFGTDNNGTSYFLSKHSKEEYTIDTFDEIVGKYGKEKNEVKAFTIKEEFKDKTLTNEEIEKNN